MPTAIRLETTPCLFLSSAGHLLVMRKIFVLLSLLFVFACSEKAASAPMLDAMAPVDAAVEVQPDAARECAFTLCGDDCVDLTVNFEHCGTCDNRCPGVKACRASVCECPAFVFPNNLSFLEDGEGFGVPDGNMKNVVFPEENHTFRGPGGSLGGPWGLLGGPWGIIWGTWRSLGSLGEP